jgi:hypothetical protein
LLAQGCNVRENCELDAIGRTVVIRHAFRFRYATLLFVAVASGLLWRVEVEIRGWTGLVWLSYFHMAIPIGSGLFLAWLHSFLPIEAHARLRATAIAVVFAAGAYVLLEASLSYYFVTGPVSVLYFAPFPEPFWRPLRYSAVAVLAAIPGIGALLMRSVGLRIPALAVVTSSCSLLVAVPLSVACLAVLPGSIPADHIHALKSGMLIPFWVLGFGGMFVYARRRT